MGYKSGYKIKCPECNKWHYPNEGCTQDSNLIKNNPKGYNKHKKNPNPKEKSLNQIEEFAKLSQTKQREIIAELGNEIYMLEKKIRPKKLKFHKFKDYYEMQHFGWKWDK